MPKVTIHITQSDNDSYFSQKLPTWRNGFCKIERKLYPAQDELGVYGAGEYGAIKIGSRFAFVNGLGDTWDIDKWAPVGWAPSAEQDDEFDSRVEALPRLQQQAGAAYTLYQVASKALQDASGDANAVDWGQVHQNVFAKAVSQDQQPAARVLEAIKLHSPGAVTPEQIATVDEIGAPRKVGISLFHVTSKNAMADIAKEGMRPLSYWSNLEPLVSYYEESIRDDGFDPVVLVVDLDDLLKSVGELAIEPDYPGVEEPITSAISKGETQIWAEWRSCEKGWRDSLSLIGSLRCRAPISPSLLRVIGAESDAKYGSIPAVSRPLSDSSWRQTLGVAGSRNDGPSP